MKTRNNVQPRFSIRILTIGAVSVMFGGVIFALSANQVQAAGPAQGAPAAVPASQPASATSQQAIIAPQDNTSATKVTGEADAAGKVQHMTNVPDGTGYEYSISAKDASGQTQAVSAGALGHDNNATLAPENASDIQAHLTLTNRTDQDELIGNANSGRINPGNYDQHKNDYNNAEAVLFINVYTPRGSLQVDGSKPATISEIKDGQEVANPDLQVYYLGTNGWQSFNQLNADEIRNVHQIGFKGVLQAGATATMNVPLVYDASGNNQLNQIGVITWGTWGAAYQAINVTTQEAPVKLWDVNQIANLPIHVTTRQGEEDHYETVTDDIPNMPTAGQVVEIIDSGNPFDKSNRTLYAGGTFRINLPLIQEALQKAGYSVNLQAGAEDQPMPYYTYSTNSQPHVIQDGAGHDVEVQPGDPYFYIEAHKIVDAHNTSFEQGSTAAQNFDQDSVLNSVKDLHYANSGAVLAPSYSQPEGDHSRVTMTVVDENGIRVLNNDGTPFVINGNTPAGTYRVRVSYPLNGSNRADMQVSRTVTVTVTAPAQNLSGQ